MARKSRKQTNSDETKIIETKVAVYKTVIYARLSVEDEREKNDCSIETQIELIKQFVNDKPYLKIGDTFSDNGFTGTNFQRPSFLKMIEEIKKGNIDCVVVKDLSRFGRNYIEVSNYIEKIFPFMGIRFISVNDDFDTFSPDMDSKMLAIQLKILMHDFYSKNLGHSVKSVCDKKREQGLYLGCHAPFGYKKDGENKYKFVIDEETAPIIRQIFAWKLQNISCSQIAELLNKSEILTPTAYLYAKGLVKHEKYAKKMYWVGNNIRRLLTNQAYIGNTAQGNEKRIQGKRIQNKMSEWLVENTHEPIIEKSDFEKVQIMLEEVKNNTNEKKGKSNSVERTDNIFKGVVFCEHCGKSLARLSKPIRNNTYRYSFYCVTCSKYTVKKPVFISENNLIDCVNLALNTKINSFMDFKQLLLSVQKSSEINAKKDNLSKKIVLVKQNLTKKENLLKELYEDLSNGILKKEEYDFAKERYLAEYEALKQSLYELTQESDTYKQCFISDNKFVQAVDELKNDFTLDKRILSTLIEKIALNSDKEVIIKYKFQDEYQSLVDFAVKNGGAMYE